MPGSYISRDPSELLPRHISYQAARTRAVGCSKWCSSVVSGPVQIDSISGEWNRCAVPVLAQKFSLLLNGAGYDADAFYELPAVGRLIVLHRYFTHSAASALDLTGNWASVAFEDFATSPCAHGQSRVLVGGHPCTDRKWFGDVEASFPGSQAARREMDRHRGDA